MRIAVFGSGGAGGYFGAQLARAGETVILIARGPHLRAIRERGLHMESAQGEFVIRPSQATDDPAEIEDVDVVIVGVKTWQVMDAARAIQPLIGTDTFVLPLQNGVETPGQLASVLGQEHVVGGLCGTMSFVAGPGRIRSIGETHFIKFGELDKRPSERTERLRQAFLRAGVTVTIPPDIQVALWEKFLLVVPWGGVSAVARAPVGVLRSVPETRELMELGMREIFAVARARQITLPAEIVEETMAFLDSLSPSGTTSLQRDIVAGRPSELEAWNGAAVRLGREAGVATPLHAFVYQSLLPMELRARKQLRFPA